MLAIKLKRIGKKHQAAFRIVVAEKRSKLKGRYVEDLGWLNPGLGKHNINKERATYWLKIGAQPTARVHNLFVTESVISAKKIPVHGKAKKSEKQEEGEVKA